MWWVGRCLFYRTDRLCVKRTFCTGCVPHFRALRPIGFSCSTNPQKWDTPFCTGCVPHFRGTQSNRFFLFDHSPKNGTHPFALGLLLFWDEFHLSRVCVYGPGNASVTLEHMANATRPLSFCTTHSIAQKDNGRKPMLWGYNRISDNFLILHRPRRIRPMATWIIAADDHPFGIPLHPCPYIGGTVAQRQPTAPAI